MVLRKEDRRAVERALRTAHPYEEPAYDLLLLPPSPEQPAGRVGVREATTLADFAAETEARLATRAWAWGDPARPIRRVAVVGGAADGEWRAAQRAGADVLVTGEVKQHVAVEAAESGFALVAAGHYATEQPGVEALRDRMAEVCPAVDWRLFVPASRGLGGTASCRGATGTIDLPPCSGGLVVRTPLFHRGERGFESRPEYFNLYN